MPLLFLPAPFDDRRVVRLVLPGEDAQWLGIEHVGDEHRVPRLFQGLRTST